LLASVRVRSELLCFTEALPARVLVESNLLQPATLSFAVTTAEGQRQIPVKIDGEASIQPGEKRNVSLDLSNVPFGVHILEAAFADAKGAVAARATDELRKLPPRPCGAPVNRATGLFKWRGRWQILRSTFPGANCAIGYVNAGRSSRASPSGGAE
jgi:hypothetical protein